MLDYFKKKDYPFKMVELNFSCPNVVKNVNSIIPYSKYPLSVKLSYNMPIFNNKFVWILEDGNVYRITLNSIANSGRFKGAYSGLDAQGRNWAYIAKYCERLKKKDVSLAGCSITSLEDVEFLKSLGVTEIGLGAIVLTKPSLIKKLK